MKRILAIINMIASYVAAISMILILLVTSVDFNCFNKNFYAKEYQELQTAQSLGMTEDDLQKATYTLLDYLQHDRDDIKTEIQLKGTKTEAFNAREASHMVDVRGLYDFAIILRYTCMGLLVASLIFMFLYAKLGALTHLSIAFMKTSILFAVFIAMIAIWAIADFDAFWTAFHRIAFRNDLWLLDPRVDLMINLFPSEFFSSMVLRIIIGFATGFGTLFIASYVYLRNKLHKMHQEILKNDEV